MDGGSDADAMTPPTTTPPTTTPVPPLECGGEPCMVSQGAAMLGTTPCCTEDDKCGGQSAIFSGCIELGLPGSYTESCPGFSLDTGFPLSFDGCCTPEGTCGAFDGSEGGFGCIPADALPAVDADAGTEPETCNYDPEETCTTILAAHCDGPEDCGSGQQCCGAFEGGGYASFTCQDSCVELAASDGIWSEICHPGQSCDQPLPVDGGMPPTMMPLPDGGIAPYECRTNAMYLPDFWYRCRDTGETPPDNADRSTASGEINCGEIVCGSGEKCCYALEANAEASQGAAHCVDAEVDCTCNPKTVGTDGGL